jgi:hypothetical protein
MPKTPTGLGKRLEIRYWNVESRILDREVAALEHQLKRLGDVRVVPISSLEDQSFSSSDLLIVAAQKIPEEDFVKWVSSLTTRIESLGKIWVPALILSDVPFETLDELLMTAARQNWYFDILSPSHMSSLPIRVANLVRIHDHLRELFRYESVLEKVEAKAVALEAEIVALRGEKS